MKESSNMLLLNSDDQYLLRNLFNGPGMLLNSENLIFFNRVNSNYTATRV